MNDLVAKLKESGRGDLAMPFPMPRVIHDLCDEAADEIERLTAALEEIAKRQDPMGGEAYIALKALRRDPCKEPE